MPSLGGLPRSLHLLHLALSPDETHEPPPSRHLQAGAQWTHPEHFVDAERLAHSLHSRHAERLPLEVAFSELIGVLARYDRAAPGQTLHACG